MKKKITIIITVLVCTYSTTIAQDLSKHKLKDLIQKISIDSTIVKNYGEDFSEDANAILLEQSVIYENLKINRMNNYLHYKRLDKIMMLIPLIPVKAFFKLEKDIVEN